MCKTVKSVISLCLCLCILLSGGAAFAEGADSKFSADDLKAAVDTGDIGTVISYYVEITGDYYRAHALDEDFAYFNAQNYLDMYQDFEPRNLEDALENYLSKGIFEGRKCGTENDPYVVLSQYPSIILCTTVTENANSPADFIAAIFTEYAKILSSLNTLQETVPNKTCTLMFFISAGNLEYGSGWSCTLDVVRTLCSLYSTPDISVTYMLGGSNKWYSSYLNSIIGKKGDAQCSNRLFGIDREALAKVIDDFCNKYQTTPESLAETVSVIQQPDEPQEMANEIINRLLSSEVLIDYGDAGSIEGGDALTNLINLSYDKYHSDTMGLILDGHGGGILSGGPDSDTRRESDGQSGLSVMDTVSGLNAAGVQNSPLSFIVYECCMMGTAELTVVLKDYYQYLFGSEDLAACGAIKFYNLLQNIENNVSSDTLAGDVMEWILSDFDASGKYYAASITTAAYSNSEDAVKAVDAFNTCCAALNTIISKTNDQQTFSDKKTIYAAMKTAGYRSMHIDPKTSKYYAYEDMLDYLIQLKKSLTSSVNSLSPSTKTDIESLCAVGGKLDTAIEYADILSKSNIYNYYSYNIYENRNGKILVTTSNYWEKIFGAEMCGFSIFMPSFSLSKSTLQAAQEELAGIRKNYTQQYRGMGFDDYLDLLDGFAAYYLNEDEVNRINNLSKELFYGVGGESCKSYSDILDISVQNIDNMTAVQIKTNDVSNSSQNSSGNNYIDVMDTLPALTCYLTAKLMGTLKTEQQNTKDFDAIIGNTKIAVRTQNSSINITSLDLDGVPMYYASGSNGGKDTHDWIQPENRSTEDLIKIYSTNADIKKEIDEIDAESLPEDEKQEKLNELFKNYAVFYGSCQTGASSVSAYHIFTKDGNYLSSSSETDQSYSSIANVSKIGFYHKVVCDGYVIPIDYNGQQKNGNVDMIKYLEEAASDYSFDTVLFDVGQGKKFNISNLNTGSFEQNLSNLGYIVCFEDENGYINSINKSEGDYVIAALYSADEYKYVSELQPKTPNDTEGEAEPAKKTNTEMEYDMPEVTDSDIACAEELTEISQNEKIEESGSDGAAGEEQDAVISEQPEEESYCQDMLTEYSEDEVETADAKNSDPESDEEISSDEESSDQISKQKMEEAA